MFTFTTPDLGIGPLTDTTSYSKNKSSPLGASASVNTWNFILSNTLFVSIASGTLFAVENLGDDKGLQHSSPHTLSTHSSDSTSQGSHSSSCLWLWLCFGLHTQSHSSSHSSSCLLQLHPFDLQDLAISSCSSSFKLSLASCCKVDWLILLLFF